MFFGKDIAIFRISEHGFPQLDDGCSEGRGDLRVFEQFPSKLWRHFMKMETSPTTIMRPKRTDPVYKVLSKSVTWSVPVKALNDKK